MCNNMTSCVNLMLLKKYVQSKVNTNRLEGNKQQKQSLNKEEVDPYDHLIDGPTFIIM